MAGMDFCARPENRLVDDPSFTGSMAARKVQSPGSPHAVRVVDGAMSETRTICGRSYLPLQSDEALWDWDSVRTTLQCWECKALVEAATAANR